MYFKSVLLVMSLLLYFLITTSVPVSNKRLQRVKRIPQRRMEFHYFSPPEGQFTQGREKLPPGFFEKFKEYFVKIYKCSVESIAKSYGNQIPSVYGTLPYNQCDERIQ
ncbi:UNVERIFIED_CONTAM: hypothetical protein RMT77_014502 [Armadillidium vulgare]